MEEGKAFQSQTALDLPNQLQLQALNCGKNITRTNDKTEHHGVAENNLFIMKKKQSGEVIFRQASNEANQVYIFPWIMDVIIFTEINFEILGY